MDKINDLVGVGRFVTIRVPFVPKKIPVNNEQIFTPDAQNFIYSALVLQADSKIWSIFEFGEDVMSVLKAYAFRHAGMQKVEIMVSRFEDGTLRLNIGADVPNSTEELVGKADFEKKADLAERLMDRYVALAKKGPVKVDR